MISVHSLVTPELFGTMKVNEAIGENKVTQHLGGVSDK